MFHGWRALLRAVRRPDATVRAPFDPQLRYPQPWEGLKEPDNPYNQYHRERAARYLSPLAPAVARDSKAVRRMRTFERRQPSVTAPTGAFFTHRPAGSGTTRLVFRDNRGEERVLVEDFRPSLVYPDVYPNGFWVSPDGRYVAYTQAEPASEGGATLHMIRSDTGAPVGAPTPEAMWASGTWLDPHEIQHGGGVFVYATVKMRPYYQDWTPYVRRVAPDGTFHDHPLPLEESALDGTQYEFQPGPEPGTVTVLTSRHPINTPTGVRVVDLEGRGRGCTVQRESDQALARVRLGPRQADGTRRLFVLTLDEKSGHRGRVLAVDPPTKPGGRPRTREIVAAEPGDVIHQFEVIDRGRDRPPALALSVRRHGADVRVDMVRLTEDTRPDHGLTVEDRWTVPLPGAQALTASEPGTEIRGHYGTISALSPTHGDGHGGLDIEYSARESIPHRLYRLTAVSPQATPTLVAGPTTEEIRATGVPDISVTLHDIPVGPERSTSMFIVRRADSPERTAGAQGTKVPAVFWPYPYYFLGGPNANFNAVMARLVGKGAAVVVPVVYGSGGQGYDELLGPRAGARVYAAEDMAAALDHLDTMPEHAGRRGRVLFVQSASGATGLDVLRYMSDRFDAAVFNRPALTTISPDNSQQPVNMDVTDPADRRAGYALSGGITETPQPLPRTIVFVYGSVDPRIPDYSVRMTAAALDDARATYHGDKAKPGGGIYLIEQMGGHFPDADEQSILSAVLGEVTGVDQRPAQEPAPNAGTATAPRVGAAWNLAPPLRASGLDRLPRAIAFTNDAWQRRVLAVSSAGLAPVTELPNSAADVCRRPAPPAPLAHHMAARTELVERLALQRAHNPSPGI